jgi:hypothetical protein
MAIQRPRSHLFPGQSRPVPVNPLTRARIDPQPPDLDPTDQIRAFRLNRAFLQIKP